MAIDGIDPISTQSTTSAAYGGRPEKTSGQPGTRKPGSEQSKEVEKLKKADREVRAHEQAHMSAGGAYVRGGATYQYQTGPDGQQYAVAGEVSIDVSPVKNNPAATIQKMEVVRAAALAPANPSSQDRAVAAQASQVAAQAAMELAQQKKGTGGGGSSAKSPIQGYTGSGQPKAVSAVAGGLVNVSV
jgi:hypothetical protein